MLEQYNILAGYLLIEPGKVEEKTTGGIFIPETAASLKQNKGKVILAGDSSEKELMQVRVGASVIYPKGAGIPVVVDKKEYLLIRQRDVLMFTDPS